MVISAMRILCGHSSYLDTKIWVVYVTCLWLRMETNDNEIGPYAQNKDTTLGVTFNTIGRAHVII